MVQALQTEESSWFTVPQLLSEQSSLFVSPSSLSCTKVNKQNSSKFTLFTAMPNQKLQNYATTLFTSPNNAINTINYDDYHLPTWT
jgi:hypothetical protein